MYFNLSGCLVSILILLVIFLLIRELWWMIVGIALIVIVAYWCRKIYILISNNNKKSEEYNPQMGEVFKVCPYCEAKLKVTEERCPNCKRPII